MNKPELFLFSRMTRYEIKKALDNKFKNLLNWRSDKKDSWLDVGCGPGIVIPEYLLPILPSTFTKIVGSDASEKMIEFANKNYKHPKLSFRLMDIEDDNIKKYLLNDNERFDHISCFFVLHFVINQALAFKNVYDLLEPNGDCLFIICSEANVFDVYYELKQNKKWNKYLSHLENKMGYYRGRKNVNEEISKYLDLAGFVDYKIDIYKNQKFDFSDYESYKSKLN